MPHVILQARTSSTRFPGKVLKPILGVACLARQIERIQGSRLIKGLTVATSDDPSDTPIESLCDSIGVRCYRGSLPDVLDRFYQAISPTDCQHVMRLTGDCPLVDPTLIDQMIESYHAGDCDYYSNAEYRTYPHGLDIELFRRECLETSWREATEAPDREHVTLYMRRRPRQFRQGHHRDSVDNSDQRWTVDYPEDYEFVCRVYESLYPHNPTFDRHDVLRLIQMRPSIATINQHRHDSIRGAA